MCEIVSQNSLLYVRNGPAVGESVKSWREERQESSDGGHTQRRREGAVRARQTARAKIVCEHTELLGLCV